MKKNVPWHILAPRRGCFGNHLPLRRVRILAERFCMIGRNFLSYKKPRSYAVLRKQATGIEPASSAWEADVLPMNYACVFYGNTVYYKSYFSKSKEIPVF